MVCAQEALTGLGIDRVLLLPVHTPPHKQLEDEPGVEHRLELCRLAAAGAEGIEVSSIEADRPGPSFTIDTLRSLHARDPGDDLTFIVGADQALGLPTWREPAALLELAELGVAGREGVSEDDVIRRLDTLPGAAARVRFFSMPRIDISSSMVRLRAHAGKPIRYLVPERVAEYVASQGLYWASAHAPEAISS